MRVPNIPDEEAERIANVLGDLPIALATAGAWIAETGTPINPYVTELERQGPSGLALDAVWKLSLEELQRRSPGAYRLLQLCSLLDPEIALEMVYSDAMATMLAPTDPQVSDRIMRGALVRQVNRLGLLRIDHRQEVGDVDSNAGGQIFVHRLLQHVIQDRMTPVERDDLRHQVHLVLTALRPDGEVDDPKTWPRLRMLWPHVEVSDAVGCQDEAVRSLIIDRVRYLWLRGDLPRGLDRAEAADAAWTSAGGDPPSPAEQEVLRRQLLHLRFHRANILRDLGRFREAHESDGAVLDEQVELLGENHPHTLMTAGGLAGDLRGLRRYPEALGRDRATSAAWRAVRRGPSAYPHRPEQSRGLLPAQRRLPQRHGDRFAGLQQAARRAGRPAPEHPDLGRRVRSRPARGGRVRAVGGTARRGVRGDRAGAGHGLPRRPRHQGQPRRVAAQRGGSEAAAELLDEAFDRLLTTFGLDSPHTLACLLSRAVNLLALEHPDAGHELDRVRRIYDDNLGRQHPHTLVCVNNLAMVARAGEDRSQARSQALEAAVGMRNVLGERHPYTLAAETNVAICTAEAGDVEEGLELMIPLARRSIDILGAEHPDALRSLANEALMRRMLGQADVELSLNRLRGTLSSRLGGAHPAVDAINRGRLLHRVIDPHRSDPEKVAVARGRHALRRGDQPAEEAGQHVDRAEVRDAGLDEHLGAGNPVAEPAGVAGRRERVLGAVPEPDRGADRAQRETPGPAQREDVVQPAVRPAAPQRLAIGIGEQLPDRDVLEDVLVGLGHLMPEEFDEAQRSSRPAPPAPATAL